MTRISLKEMANKPIFLIIDIYTMDNFTLINHPIYATKDSSNEYGVSGTVFYSEPFGWKDWSFNATGGWYEEDHDIDFYDASVGVVVFGMFRKF